MSNPLVKDDFPINLNLPIYEKLINQIKELKKNSKPLRIKINSHPGGGKSTFIQNNEHIYRNYKLIDFDIFVDGVFSHNATSESLLEFDNAVLFGSQENETHNNDIIYIYVIPPLTDLYRNIIHRQLTWDNNIGWANAKLIMNYRQQNVYDFTIRNNTLIEPLFYSFSQALDFCIDTYES